MSIALPHGSMAASPWPRSTSASSPTFRRRPGRQGGVRLCRRSRRRGAGEFGKGPEIGKDLSALPQVAAVIPPAASELTSGTDCQRPCGADGRERGAKLGWHVLFEQPTAQALTPIRDQLVRIALLIGLGLVVAILAGTIWPAACWSRSRRCAPARRRLGAGDFGHRIEVKTARRTGRARRPVQQHGRPAAAKPIPTSKRR